MTPCITYDSAGLAQALGAELLGHAAPAFELRHLLIDSRQLSEAAHSLFFALRGKVHDGRRFVGPLHDAGLRHVVLSAAPEVVLPETSYYLVPDVVAALQRLAAQHRQRFQLPVLAITGSNGKTIIKEWLAKLLREDYRLARSPKSYNSQLGVPLSVWQLRPEHDFAIFEAGISRTGEMARLADIIRPSIGLFSNLGAAHDEGFASRAEKAAEKALLFREADTLIYCADHAEVREALAGHPARHLCWSREREDVALRLRAQIPQGQGCRLLAEAGGEALALELPFSDAASVENAVHCWLLLRHLGYAQANLAPRFAQLGPVAMRLELIEGIQGCRIINDSYSADTTSLGMALHLAAQQGTGLAGLTLILSDIQQSGLPPAQLYAQVGQMLAERRPKRLIGVGTHIAALAPWLPEQTATHFYPDTESLLRHWHEHTFRGEMVVVKGAREFALEQVVRRLAKQIHNTVLEVDLDALIHNLDVFRSALRPGVRLMAMVKAAAYGSGSVEVARLLAERGADYLCVAYTDEGVELREAGLRLPIMVLNPDEAGFDSLIQRGLEPEIYSLPLLRAWLRVADEQSPPVHLKLDTGMRRLGFEAADLPDLLALLQQHPWVRVASVFSHLAASEAPEHDAFSRQQAAQFEALYRQLAAGLGYAPLRHLLNSSGIVRWPDLQMDMVRLGIGLYGIDASGQWQAQLRPISTLKARISQIKSIGPDDTVGYGRRGRLPAGGRIGTLSIGYADGIGRACGNGRFRAWLRGQRVPTLGNICMDMCMIDLSAVPEAREGDEVEFFGPRLPIQLLADCMDTIPYEVLTRIPARVPRVYFRE